MKTSKSKASKPSRAGCKKILVAVDFSNPSRQSLQQAAQLAQAFGAELCLAYVVEPVPFISGAHTDPLMMSDQKFAALAATKLERVAADEIPSGVNVTTKVLRGRAHKEIAAFAKRWPADLIVIATHGYTGLKHAFLGSTAEAVVRYAPCPVLVTRRRQ